jgi:hypothetical protein
VGSDRGVTPLNKKKTLVQLAQLVVPCKGPLPGYRKVLNGSFGGGGDLRYGEIGGRGNPTSWGLIQKKPLPCGVEGSSKARGDNPDRKQPA